jgi:hypothetical protein
MEGRKELKGRLKSYEWAQDGPNEQEAGNRVKETMMS